METKIMSETVYKKREDGKYIAIGKTELVDGENSVTLDIPKNKLALNDISIIGLGVNLYDPYYYTQNNYETHKNFNYVKLENVSGEMYTFQHYVDNHIKDIDSLPLAIGFEGLYWDTFDTKINDSYKKIDDNHFTLLNKHQVFIYKYRIHDERMVPVGVVTIKEGKKIGYLFFSEPNKRFKDNMTISLYSKNEYVQKTTSPRMTVDVGEFYKYSIDEMVEPTQDNQIPEIKSTLLYERVNLDEIWLSPEKGEWNEIEEIHGSYHDVIGYTHKLNTRERRFVLYNQYLAE